MKKFINFIIFCCFMLTGFSVCAQEKQEIPDISIQNGDVDFSAIKDSPFLELISAPVISKMPSSEPEDETSFGKTFMRYIRLYTYFNLKYPGAKIEGSLQQDLQKLFPDEDEFELEDRAENVRTVIRLYRAFDRWLAKIAARIMTPQEPPLIVEEDEYATAYDGKYIESDKLVVILDFKKVIPYAGDKRNFEAVEAKMERDALKESSKLRRFHSLTQKLSKIEWSKLPFYGVLFPDPLTGNRGVGSWSRFEAGIVRMVADSTALGNFGEVRIVLYFMFPKGTYLKDTPGNRLEISSEKSQNLAGFKLFRPVPQRLPDDQKNTGVFMEEAAFPITVYAQDITQQLDLNFTVSGEFCRQDGGCKKMSADVFLGLAPGIRENSTMRHFVKQNFLLRPQEQHKDLSLKHIWLDTATNGKEKDTLRLVFESKEPLYGFQVFAESPGFSFGAPKVSIDGKKAVARFDVLPGGLLGKEVTVTAQTSPTTSIRRTGQVTAAPLFDIEGQALTLMLILTAVAGGLILNVMPCVFPVLSLKILSLSGFGAGTTPKVRRGFFMIVCGIVCAFALMTGLLISLKLLGHSIGWGMQFQSPSFLWIMIFVMILFLAQIAGWINMKTPEWINRLLDSKSKEEDLQNFLIGLFLVALSTPCSAPYLGTAIGFALAGSVSDIAVIMSAVGFGLALPYLLLYINPQLADFIPHPDKWTRYLLQIMSLMLVATILWLISVLAAQISSGSVMRAGLYVLAAIGLLAFQKAVFDNIEMQKETPELKIRLRRFFTRIFTVLLLLLWGCGWADVVSGYQKKREETLSQKQIELSLPEIKNYLNQGKTVLVSVEADWCLTCKFNDITVLNTAAIKETFRAHGVKVIEIDWTNYNAEVLKFMEEFGRKGLPFYILFSPKIPNGMVLPEILNYQDLMEIIKNISKS